MVFFWILRRGKCIVMGRVGFLDFCRYRVMIRVLKNKREERLTLCRARLDFGSVVMYLRDGKVVRAELKSDFEGKGDRNLGKRIRRVWREGFNKSGFQFDLQNLSGFARRVLWRCAQIPFGRVMSYGELARAIGKPGAARAVGQVMAHNPLPLFFPCHRVVAKNGRLGGFAGGAEMKIRLLRSEGWQIKGRGFNARLVK